MNEYQKKLVEKVGSLASKCMQLSMITNYAFTLKYSISIELQVSKFYGDVEGCISYYSPTISWSIYEEDVVMQQLSELEKQVDECLEIESPLKEWVVSMAEKHLEDNEDATKQELCEMLDLEPSDVAHLYPEPKIEKVSKPSMLMPSEQAMKYAGHSYKDFI